MSVQPLASTLGGIRRPTRTQGFSRRAHLETITVNPPLDSARGSSPNPGMRRLVQLFLATATLVITLVGTHGTANALVEVGLGFRYGAEQNDSEVNPWGPGVGINAGITLPNSIYVGGGFDYFFGETADGVSDLGSFETTQNIWELMAVGGYSLDLLPLLTIRPNVGVGIASLAGEVCFDDDCTDDDATDLVIAPGATVIVSAILIEVFANVRYAV